MLLGIVKRERPNDDVVRPLNARARHHVCVGDPRHGRAILGESRGGRKSPFGDQCVRARRTTFGSLYRPIRRDQADARRSPRAHRGAPGAGGQRAQAREARPGRDHRPPRRVHPRRRRTEGPEARLATRRRRGEDRLVQGVDQGQHVGAGLPREGNAFPGLDRRLLLSRRRRLRHPAPADEEVARAVVVPRRGAEDRRSLEDHDLVPGRDLRPGRPDADGAGAERPRPGQRLCVGKHTERPPLAVGARPAGGATRGDRARLHRLTASRAGHASAAGCASSAARSPQTARTATLPGWRTTTITSTTTVSRRRPRSGRWPSPSR